MPDGWTGCCGMYHWVFEKVWHFIATLSSLTLTPAPSGLCVIIVDKFVFVWAPSSLANIASIDQRTIDNVASGSSSTFITSPLSQICQLTQLHLAGVHESEEEEEDHWSVMSQFLDGRWRLSLIFFCFVDESADEEWKIGSHSYPRTFSFIAREFTDWWHFRRCKWAYSWPCEPLLSFFVVSWSITEHQWYGVVDWMVFDPVS